ncbi:hypothetical protein KAR91_74500 [Candidatus Pacearchaeota archaeon]|nr:hypothetical protein [Candidatus Pacearchaeota archaeon]
MAKLSSTNRDIVLHNLLHNSQFSEWSDGTIENVGSAIVEDDCANDDTGDWTTSGDSITFDTDHYEAASSDINKLFYFANLLNVTGNKIYQISVDLKDGTAINQSVSLYKDDQGANTYNYSPPVTTTNSWVTHNYIFKAEQTYATGHVGIRVNSNPGGDNIEYKNFTIYEVTPGCVAVNNLGPDGWGKDTTLDIWRQHQDTTYTQDGSFYSLKATKTVDSEENLKWLVDLMFNDEHIDRFRGRTVTAGCWVYSVGASDNVRLRLYYGSNNQRSSYAGADGWEWLEVTLDVSSNPSVSSAFSLWIEFIGDVSDVAYISQPMLVFGETIGEGNYQPSPTDPPIITGLESLEKAHGKAFIWDKNKGLVVENRPLQNLLTNSGFEIWSNSTLSQGSGSGQQTDFVVNNEYTDIDGSTFADWTSTTATISDIGANLLITADDASGTQNCYYDFSGLTVGKLYKISLVTADGTGVWGAIDYIKARATAGAGGDTLATYTGLAAGTYSLIFKATAATNSMQIVSHINNTETLSITSIYVDEVTPGCVGANYLGPDGWGQYNTNLDSVFRDSNVTKDSANYSVKLVGGVAVSGLMYPTIGRYQKEEWVQKFKGKTVTFGAWVKTLVSNVRLLIHTNLTNSYSSNHTGGGDWEWLEITITTETNIADFYVRCDVNAGDVAYITQPMLVFGSYIGEGNYSRPPGEVIHIENCFDSAIYNNSNGNWSSKTDVINIEADSSGKLGKGVTGLDMYLRNSDSGSGSAGINVCYCQLYSSEHQDSVTNYIPSGTPNNQKIQERGWVSTDDGHISLTIAASGVLTFDMNQIRYNSVRLR